MNSSKSSVDTPIRTPLVSVVVLNWNGKSILGECLDAVLKTTYSPLEIIVVDNGSEDGSVPFVAENYPSIIIVDNKSNLGYAAGNNRGFSRASGDYIVALNNDVIVAPEWLDGPVKLLNTLPDAGIVACVQLNYYSREYIDCLFVSPNDQLMHNKIGHGLHISTLSQFPVPGYVFASNGASAIYRASMLKNLGGFDERFFAYHEESDLCMRAFLSGWKCVYSPTSIVYHKLSQSFNKIPAKMCYLGERNRYWYIFKNFPLSYILINTVNLLKGEWWCIAMVFRKKYPLFVYLQSRIDCLLGIFKFIPDHFRSSKSFRNYRIKYERFITQKIIPIDGSF